MWLPSEGSGKCDSTTLPGSCPPHTTPTVLPLASLLSTDPNTTKKLFQMNIGSQTRKNSLYALPVRSLTLYKPHNTHKPHDIMLVTQKTVEVMRNTSPGYS